MSLWTKIRQFFQPYYRPKPKELSRRNLRKRAAEREKIAAQMEERRIRRMAELDEKRRLRLEKKAAEQKVLVDKLKAELASGKTETPPAPPSETPADPSHVKASQPGPAVPDMNDPDIRMRILDSKIPLDEPMRFKRLPGVDTVWVYHSDDRHQVLACLPPGGRKRYRVRSDEKRMTLKPRINPTGEQYDRTHIIPFGYHGSENDPRLVIGWSAEQNQGVLKEFEDAMAKAPFNIIWFADIRRTKTGAEWTYQVYRESDRKRISGVKAVYDGPMRWM